MNNIIISYSEKTSSNLTRQVPKIFTFARDSSYQGFHTTVGLSICYQLPPFHRADHITLSFDWFYKHLKPPSFLVKTVVLVRSNVPLIFWNLCAHKISFVQHITKTSILCAV